MVLTHLILFKFLAGASPVDAAPEPEPEVPAAATYSGGWLKTWGDKPSRKRDEDEPQAAQEATQAPNWTAPIAKAQARQAKALAAQVKAMEASVRALEAEALALREAQEQARVRTEIERLTQAIESQNFLLAQAEAEAIEDDNAAISLILGMVL